MIVIAPLYGTDIEWREDTWLIEDVIGYLLDYTERALEVRPGDAAIRAVRALGLALESPDDLSRSHEAMRRAHERKTGSRRVKR